MRRKLKSAVFLAVLMLMTAVWFSVITASGDQVVTVYKVTFDANGGYFNVGEENPVKKTVVSKNVKAGDRIQVAPSDKEIIWPYHETLYFNGWFLDKKCTIPVLTDTKGEFEPTKNITLYASWSAIHTLHYFVAEQIKAPTCTAAGKAKIVCRVCSQTKGTKELPALGHDLKVTKKAVAATCTKEGKTAEKTCKRCGKVIEKQKAVPKAKHHYKKVRKEKAPTCISSGLTALFRCEKCGRDKEPQKKIPRLGHDYKTTRAAVAATCTTDGKTAEIKCARCGRVQQKQTTIPKLGHDLKVTKAAVPATCTTDGKTAQETCKRCKKIIRKQRKVSKLGHDKVIDPEVPATCKSEGKTRGSHCARCGKILEEQKKIPKSSTHTWGSWTITKQPTIRETGSRTRKCTVCGKTETETMERITATISLSKSYVTLLVGAYNSEYTNITAYNLQSGDYVSSWRSSNTSVAEVDQNGKITAKNPGYATVTASTGYGASASVSVTVKYSTMKTTSLSVKILDKIIKGKNEAREVGAAADGIITVKQGTKTQITPTFTPSMTGDKVTYHVEGSDAYVTVNEKGEIIAKTFSSPIGSGMIIVKSGSCNVRIRVNIIK